MCTNTPWFRACGRTWLLSARRSERGALCGRSSRRAATPLARARLKAATEEALEHRDRKRKPRRDSRLRRAEFVPWSMTNTVRDMSASLFPPAALVASVACCLRKYALHGGTRNSGVFAGVYAADCALRPLLCCELCTKRPGETRRERESAETLAYSVQVEVAQCADAKFSRS